MIVVEGMDNSGKTTLVQQISSRFNLPIQPSLGPPSPERALEILSGFMVSREFKIYDRLVAFSDTVYGPPIRGRVVTDPHQWTWIHKVLSQKPFVIYCRPPDEVVLSFGDRAQMGGVVERGRKLLGAYDALFQSIEDFFGIASFANYDYTSVDSTQSLWLNLEEYIEMQTNLRSLLSRLDQGARV